MLSCINDEDGTLSKMKNLRIIFLLLILFSVVSTSYSLAQKIASSKPTQTKANDSSAPLKAVKESATVPLIVEFNRPFVDLEFTKPDGSLRKARFWVDTGGGGFILCESLANDLNLKLGQTFTEEGSKIAAITPPPASLGGMPLNLEGARSFVTIGAKTVMPGVNAEGLFPGHILKRYHVIFDYPGRKFTLAKPGSIKPRGTRINSPVNQRSGFPRIEAQIGGETYGFLLDTGASFTMISQELLAEWSGKNPTWQKTTGAYGAANMGLGQMEAKALMLRLPDVQLADFHLQGIAAVSRPKGTFENYMSQMMAAPIKGAIGGNLLRAFRIEIDYAGGATYLEKKATPDKNDMDIVGVTLRTQADGSYSVSAVAGQYSKEILEAIHSGDKLIKVDKLEVKNMPHAKVIDALRGKPNQNRTLVFERDGRQFTVTMPALRVL
jgi:predicted aspartyl protease